MKVEQVNLTNYSIHLVLREAFSWLIKGKQPAPLNPVLDRWVFGD